MRKLLSTVTLLAFLFTNTGFAQNMALGTNRIHNLSGRPAIDDMLEGTPYDNILAFAAIALKMDLGLLNEIGGIEDGELSEEAVRAAFEKVREYKKEKLRQQGLKREKSRAFYKSDEIKSVIEGKHVFWGPVYARRKGSLHKCILLISTKRENGQLRAALCLEDEFEWIKAFIAENDRIPERAIIDTVVKDLGKPTRHGGFPATPALLALRMNLVKAAATGKDENKAAAPSPLLKFRDIGQRIWLDGLTWEMIKTSEFERLVRDHNITGVTTNPTLIKAYLKDDDVLAKISDLARRGLSRDDIYFDVVKELALAVIGAFKKYGVDGKFSVELNPEKADDAEASVQEAIRWTDIDKDHMMVKVAATEAGYRIIEEVTAIGRNVNATLIFTPEQYLAVAEAYMRGLERASAAGYELSKIYSVASFFISRWDVKLAAKLPKDTQGKFANGIVTCAYNEIFRQLFFSDEFKRLAENGAKPQGFLLASTGSKRSRMPEAYQEQYPDDIYVRPVMGPDVVNTLPYETIQYLIDNPGDVTDTIIENYEASKRVVQEASRAADTDFASEGKELSDEGMKSFIDDFRAIMKTIEDAIEGVQRSARAGTTTTEVAEAGGKGEIQADKTEAGEALGIIARSPMLLAILAEVGSFRAEEYIRACRELNRPDMESTATVNLGTLVLNGTLRHAGPDIFTVTPEGKTRIEALLASSKPSQKTENKTPLDEVLALIKAYLDGAVEDTDEILNELNAAGLAIDAKEGKAALVFTEEASFGKFVGGENEEGRYNPGLAPFLANLAKEGMKIGVIYDPNKPKEKELIGQFNRKLNLPEDKQIVCVESADTASQAIKAARYYYFKVEGETAADPEGFQVQTITVDMIIELLGRIYGITEKGELDNMKRAARLFAKAA